MARSCASCEAPFSTELDRQVRAGVPLAILSAWTREQGHPISRNALTRHRRDHLGTVVTSPGRKPVSGDYLEAVRDDAHQRLVAGEIRASVKDGVQAQSAIDRRAAANLDRDLALRLASILSGAYQPTVKVLDPAWDALDDEVAALIGAGE